MAMCSGPSTSVLEPPALAAIPAEPPAPAAIPADTIRAALREALQGKDLDQVSAKEIREQAASMLGLAAGGLECRKREIRKLLTTLLSHVFVFVLGLIFCLALVLFYVLVRALAFVFVRLSASPSSSSSPSAPSPSPSPSFCR